MPRSLKWGIPVACIIILSQDFHKKCWKIAFPGFLEIEKIGKPGESTKSYFPAFL
jgi:hypothetical protein